MQVEWGLGWLERCKIICYAKTLYITASAKLNLWELVADDGDYSWQFDYLRLHA